MIDEDALRARAAEVWTPERIAELERRRSRGGYYPNAEDIDWLASLGLYGENHQRATTGGTRRYRRLVEPLPPERLRDALDAHADATAKTMAETVAYFLTLGVLAERDQLPPTPRPRRKPR